MLTGKKIILGVTGSIAAYKAANIIRLLKKQGAEVKVIMTPTAKEFITPLTLATLSKNPILVEFFNPENGAWNSHVALGEWADAYLIAPATAATLAKMATGIADNLLVTTYLSAKCPVLVAPAMDLDMYAHPTTQHNLNTLRAFGNTVIEPTDGELASGLSGKGRLEDPQKIVEILDRLLSTSSEKTPSKKKTLTGKRILVNAGPTIENIDPVRFISNYSSGKMGYAIAEACAARGADVVLVSGKVTVQLNPAYVSQIEIRNVTSAHEMYEACAIAFTDADAAILAAAVADYTPAEPAPRKIKKQNNEITLRLRKNVDIAAELGRIKGSKILVGFALETDHETQYAREKLVHKNLDFIVLNSLQDSGAGFQSSTNKIAILTASGEKHTFPLKSKQEVAEDIVDTLAEYLNPTPSRKSH